MLVINNQLSSCDLLVSLGVIEVKVAITPSPDTLKELLKAEASTIQAADKSVVLSAKPILDARQAYASLGRHPDRYPVSSEALIRRILQGKALYYINNAVEVNNLLSLRSRYSVGSYDLKQLEGDIVLRVGKNAETYKGIGKAEFQLENLPVLADDKGPFGSPTSDSERAMITPRTDTLMMIVYGFGTADLNLWLNMGADLLKQYALATEINIYNV